MYIAISNSIGSSSRVNAGGGGGGFTNTYSLAFDGVDDYVDCGDSDNLSFGNGSTDSPFTFSAWVKLDSLSSNNTIVSKDLGTIGITREYALFVLPTGKVKIFLKSQAGNSQQSIESTTALSTGQWYHIGCTYNGVGGNNAADGLTLYVNGSAETPTNVTKQTYVAMSNTTATFRIGKYALANLMAGSVDEVAIWNNVQDVASIYSASGAVDLSSLNPTLWLRNGDNGSYKSPQWLIPNNSNKDKVSNYSLQFDGVDDEILTSSNFVATGEFTISLWMKPTIFNSNQNILGFGTSGSNFINPNSATNIRVRTSSTLLNFPETGGNNLVLNAWNHILIYRDSSNNIGVFVNGATFGATSNDTGSLSLSTIGRGATKRFAGNLDEIAFWNTNKSSDISSIYSGGTPSDLSSLSPVAYYKMGEEATFVYNVNPEGTWTIPDQAGSSDGTSNNTFLDTGRVGDAPNSTSNAVSFNMLETDRKEDTPPTP